MLFRFVESFWLLHERSLAAGILLLAFVTFALWETFRPRRAAVAPTALRWFNHAILLFLCSAAAAWIFRASAVVAAVAASAGSHGLSNREFLPFGVRCMVAVLALDLLRYAQHYCYHAFPWLWRIHRVHHADPDYDWSTGLRFHPVEVLLTQGIYLGAIALLAPPAVAVFALELADAVQNFFVHANVSVPQRVEQLLRRFLITPDMHRIHHSEEIGEQNKNFGVVFPWWDRLFGTYIREPAAGYDKMGLGLRGFQGARDIGLLGMLALPFRKAQGRTDR